jgi:L-lactate dehydrogenase complex protein LldF
MEVKTDQFRQGVERALRDSNLQEALENATSRFTTLRSASFDGFPEGEALRDKARRIKEQTLGGLDRYLSELADSVRGLGGHVHWALDAAEARQIVVDLTKRYDLHLAVKSKSMVTEEIGLNKALEEAGVEPVETDLGEYIIQLAGETPSHIIAPAIHKTKDDVSRLFVDKLGSPFLDKHEDLTREARRHLRDKFRRADLGITGANFAVAKTGSIVLVENEGNIRLTTSLPRIHIAIVGMEKVIPDLEALSVFLRILARSATGQKASSYVSIVTGPRREHEEDGPEAFHLVILDNGRSRLLANPKLREALYCLRCGACLNTCPVYRHAGGHAYGFAYSGPIGAIITPSLVGHERASDLPYASSLCGACRDVCPVHIDIPHLLLEQRKQVVQKKLPSRGLERILMRLFRAMASSASRFRLVGRLSYWLSRMFVRDGRIPKAPMLTPWTRSRDFPAPAAKTFRQRWAEKRGRQHG